MRFRGMASFALLLALAGCIEEATPGASPAGATPPSTPPESAASEAAPRADPPPGPGPAAGAYAPGWPRIEDAVIRPGVQVGFIGPIAGNSQSFVAGCTSNFVFASPDNRTLFLGTAAHCVEDDPLGTPVAIAKGAAVGVLHYSSFLAMEAARETDEALLVENDFALLRIEEKDRARVHPAVLHFGGPVALADTSELKPGDGLLAYGNTDLRPRVEESNHHSGCVAEVQPWIVRTYWTAPTMGGDSGSGVLTADGRAAGVHRGTFYTTGEAGIHEETRLDLALRYAREKAGVDVALATWPLLGGTATIPGPATC